MDDDFKPRYVISVAAEMLDARAYTLRYYERVGIIKPARSRGNIRLYSERDLALLRRVRTLMEDLGVNLAGREVILRMDKHIAQITRAAEELGLELGRLRRGEA